MIPKNFASNIYSSVIFIATESVTINEHLIAREYLSENDAETIYQITVSIAYRRLSASVLVTCRTTAKRC